jgi:hypothetical protein
MAAGDKDAALHTTYDTRYDAFALRSQAVWPGLIGIQVTNGRASFAKSSLVIIYHGGSDPLTHHLFLDQ